MLDRLFRAALLAAAAAMLSQTLFAEQAHPAAIGQSAAGTGPVGALPGSKPLELGVFADGGLGTNTSVDDRFFNLGVHAGKVLTGPAGPGWLRGQFEYGIDVIPFWQAYTPVRERVNCSQPPGESAHCTGGFNTGGTYTGISIVPIILRWNLVSLGKRWMPWVQGAGGFIWTNHKFPPLYGDPAPGHQGTSVFNFTPQFGVGVHYFLRPRQSINFSANAVHISSASLGDANPGVNATVQFALGYTWWR